MAPAQKRLIYLYCVTKTKPSRSNFKDIGVKIYPIYFQGTYAIVSKVSSNEFSENSLKKNLADMKWVEKKARQHEKVIEEIMRDVTVLPFKFAAIFETEDNVKKLLKERSTEFKKIIANLEGKEEWGLKMYCDMKRFKDICEKEDERIKEKDKEIESASKGKAYFLKKKRDEFIKGIINESISNYTQDCFERLSKVSLETKINKILPKEVTEKKEDMVFNAAFLINKKRVQEFNNVFEYIKTKYSDKGLSFDCTGPWAPYNFCSFSEVEESKNE